MQERKASPVVLGAVVSKEIADAFRGKCWPNSTSDVIKGFIHGFIKECIVADLPEEKGNEK